MHHRRLPRILASAFALLLLVAAPLAAQGSAIRFVVRGPQGPLQGAVVALDDQALPTDSAGRLVWEVGEGTHRFRISARGFHPETREIAVRPRGDTTVLVTLRPAGVDGDAEEEGEHDGDAHGDEHGEGHEEGETHEIDALVVEATRGRGRLADLPIRVEVLGREEVEEKMMMTPGDVSMMLNETGGLRVQTTSPGLGGAGVRVQGLRGRYTQVLADGLPLYGGQAGSLGLLQVPPMDLARVEVVKGAVSSLYGGSALGGVVNLVSRRPDGSREVLANATSRGGADLVGWSTGALSADWGYTLLAGLHGQRDADVDDDGWADIPSYRRVVVRPRFFRGEGTDRAYFLTAGAMAEEREGGGRVPGGDAYPEALRTVRLDAGFGGSRLLAGGRLLRLRASAMTAGHRHRLGPDPAEEDRHATWMGEASLGGVDGGHSWVVGAAVQQERFRSDDFPEWDFVHTTPGVFAQDDWTAAPWLAFSGSARVDRHSEYGTRFSPRVSALVRPAEGWSVRASAGGGYFAPTPFIEEVEAVGLRALYPTEPLRVERARTASLDVGRSADGLELNATLFGSVVEDAVRMFDAGDDIQGNVLRNVPGETRTWGTELLARYHRGGLHVTASHTYTRATEPVSPFGGGRREVPLTPRHQAGVVAAWEAEGRGRIGVEAYYTGRQQLDDDPYRDRSRDFVVFGVMAERRFGNARVFVNLENLGDVRQTRWSPLLLPAPADGRATVDAWAPLEGRVINAGVRLGL